MGGWVVAVAVVVGVAAVVVVVVAVGDWLCRQAALLGVADRTPCPR